VEPTSVADYCREVEAHLTRVNGGHLVRVAGPGFELVRGWQAQGIPLSVVTRAIDQKAERHQRGAGARGRPQRIEFCADDVQELFENWKRAVGVHGASEEESRVGPSDLELGRNEAESPTRKPSLSKHLERVTDRLSRLLGRNDLPEPFLERVNYVIGVVAAARERAKGLRGPARDEVAESLRPLDRVLAGAARAALTADESRALETQAAAELIAYRDRLDPAAWQQALAATSDRLLRERFALPVVDPDAS
jgi:hypothetical protein